jgi:hypothetical protein
MKSPPIIFAGISGIFSTFALFSASHAADPAVAAPGAAATRHVEDISFTGHGDCVYGNAHYPEPGITGVGCFLALSDLPPQYIGGVLTTNSILSRSVLGGTSDPPDYTQPAITTVRLRKRRLAG